MLLIKYIDSPISPKIILIDFFSSLSTIRESSPVHSVEEWSPTPNEDEQIDSNSVKSLDNRQTLHKDSTTKTRSHPIGFVNNYISKWKNKIKK